MKLYTVGYVSLHEKVYYSDICYSDCMTLYLICWTFSPTHFTNFSLNTHFITAFLQQSLWSVLKSVASLHVDSFDHLKSAMDDVDRCYLYKQSVLMLTVTHFISQSMVNKTGLETYGTGPLLWGGAKSL